MRLSGHSVREHLQVNKHFNPLIRIRSSRTLELFALTSKPQSRRFVYESPKSTLLESYIVSESVSVA
jgi:hypothetical protein